MARSKWEIEWAMIADMVRRRDELDRDIAGMKAKLNGYRETHSGLNCSGCGFFIETERDFAQHFLIEDERYLNLGECPRTEKGKILNNGKPGIFARF